MRIRSVLQGIPRQEELLGDAEVCIAVLDGPVDLAHPCFVGADLTRLDTLVQDPAGRGPMSLHGTHVASLLFGQMDSPVEGIAPRCRGLILPVFRDAQGWRVPQLDLARAIERAVEEGAHIINISGGERSSDGQAEYMLDRALRLCDERGVLVVAAVGNDGCDCLQAPAATPSVLAVGATGTTGEPLDSNNWGATYRTNGVVAPGQDIEGAAPGGGRLALTGTSFATPIVSGVAALLVAAQLQAGLKADPAAAGRAILESATPPSCSPSDAPECRRHLAGNLNAAGAFRIITTRAGIESSDPGPAPIPPATRMAAPRAGVISSGPRVNAAGAPSSLRMSKAEPNEGASAMNTHHTTTGDSVDITDGPELSAEAALAPDPPAQFAVEEETEHPPHRAEDQSTDTPPPPEPIHYPPNEGIDSMDTPTAPPTASAGTPPQGEASTGSPPASTAWPGAANPSEGHGVRPSSECGCGDSPSSGCQCGGNGNGPRQFVYAIGTIGFDYQTEARRDYFRQHMPWVPGEPQGGRETEVPPNIYDPRQLHHFLSKKPWLSNYLTWTLMLDSTHVYALEPETPVGMDWLNPLIKERATPTQVAAAAKAATKDPDKLAKVIETLMYPPVSHVHRIFRDAIVGQIKPADDVNYVSRVSIPGELTGRTTQLFNGDVVPTVKVKGTDSLATWNEALLVNEVVKAVKKTREGKTTPALDEAFLRTTLRALFDKIYQQFRNLGQSSADRALNAAGTNAFLEAKQFAEGIMSAEHVPGAKDNFYVLDTVSVSKSPYGRPRSDCQDVTITFFDPQDERRARVHYQFTFDVSDYDPVSLAPVHKFIGS